MARRKIAIFTGNRAEYGLLCPVIRAIAAHPGLEPFLLVSGAHLEDNFGRTVAEIEHDGLAVYREVKLTMPADNLVATAQAIGSGILDLSRILAELRPDVLVVYADRFEGFAAVITGSQMGIPVAHVEGGDLTEGGALDDMVRHAMTKLAHLHFTTNPQATERVKKLGEEPWRVHTVGFPALDLIAAGDYASEEELAARYGLDPAKPLVIFTQHSVTTEFEQAPRQVRPSLEALADLAGRGVQVLVTYPNNDAGGLRIIAEIEGFTAGLAPELKPLWRVERSLGRRNYHGVLALCGLTGRGACLGNSSSGIKETPALFCPAVNIGSRQQGRLRAGNVLDTGYDRGQILAASQKALWDEAFREQCRTGGTPYGRGDAGRRIAEVLATVELSPRLVQKRMTY